MEVGAGVRLLVFAFVVGERACLVPASRSGPGSHSARPASRTISRNGMAFTTPRICIASSRRRASGLSPKPSFLRPGDVDYLQRRPSSMASDKAELPWSGSTCNEAFDSLSDADNDRKEPHADTPGEQQPSAWTNDIWEGDWDEMSASSQDETGSPPPSSGSSGGLRVGSQEFTDLVKAQFDILATVVTEASRIVLFTRHENAETGGFDFVPALEYPESEDGAQVREGPKGLPLTGNAVDSLSDSDIPVYNTADPFNSPTTMENDDGSLSAPIMYASVAMGMITMWAEKRSDAKQTPGGEGSEDDPVSAGAKATTGDQTAWDEQDKQILEKVSGSVAMAAVLDQKQRWAAVMQVKQLRGVIAESLHQVKNPMTALRTFGKLLLRRLPPDDTLNRELAKDILLQSDRVVDLLLPIDAVIGLLGQAVDTADTAPVNNAGGELAGGGTHPRFEGIAAAAPSSSFASVSSNPGVDGVEPFSRVGERREAGSLPWSVSQEVQDALLSPSPGEDWTEGLEPVAPAGFEALPASKSAPVDLVSVHDVIGTVAMKAKPIAESRWVRFRWDVGEPLPDVLGCARALEGALLIVLEKAVQSCELVGGRQATEEMGTVVLTAQACTQAEWGANGGVVITVVGSADLNSDQETDGGKIPHTLYDTYWDREKVDTAVGERVDLDTAAELMRSCGGDLMVGNKANKISKDGREWGEEVKLFLPIHRRRFQE